MIASAQTIAYRRPIRPYFDRSTMYGMTFGLSPAGYDIRIDEAVDLHAGAFVLASSLEEFDMPDDWLGVVHDKSTWARRGLCVQNTVIEPGWKGFLTLELTNHSRDRIQIQPGCPIAQIIFHILDFPTATPYDGKYQNQKRGPQEAI